VSSAVFFHLLRTVESRRSRVGGYFGAALRKHNGSARAGFAKKKKMKTIAKSKI
jgi:hypothetical protein